MAHPRSRSATASTSTCSRRADAFTINCNAQLGDRTACGVRRAACAVRRAGPRAGAGRDRQQADRQTEPCAAQADVHAKREQVAERQRQRVVAEQVRKRGGARPTIRRSTPPATTSAPSESWNAPARAESAWRRRSLRLRPCRAAAARSARARSPIAENVMTPMPAISAMRTARRIASASPARIRLPAQRRPSLCGGSRRAESEAVRRPGEPSGSREAADLRHGVAREPFSAEAGPASSSRVLACSNAQVARENPVQGRTQCDHARARRCDRAEPRSPRVRGSHRSGIDLYPSFAACRLGDLDELVIEQRGGRTADPPSGRCMPRTGQRGDRSTRVSWPRNQPTSKYAFWSELFNTCISCIYDTAPQWSVANVILIHENSVDRR